MIVLRVETGLEKDSRASESNSARRDRGACRWEILAVMVLVKRKLGAERNGVKPNASRESKKHMPQSKAWALLLKWKSTSGPGDIRVRAAYVINLVSRRVSSATIRFASTFPPPNPILSPPRV